MKNVIIILICLSVASWVWAGDLRVKGYIKVDPLRGGQNYLLLNDDGNEKARIKKDPLWSTGQNRYLILNRDANEKAIIRPSLLWPDRLIIEK